MFTSSLFDWVCNNAQIMHKHLQQPEQRVWRHMLYIIMNNASSQRTDRNEKKNQTMEFSASHQHRHMHGSSALLKACHQREGQRLHCTKTTSREHSMTSYSYLCIRCKDCTSASIEIRGSYRFNRRMGVLLTVREWATTYSLIEYRHKEHVTVFEIRFHFINGLDPERERNTI